MDGVNFPGRRFAPPLLALWLLMPARPAAAETGTSQNLLLRYSLGDGWYLSSINNFATRDGAAAFSIGYVDLTIGRSLGGGFAMDAGYRHAWVNLPGGVSDENRPLLNLRWSGPVGDWFLLNRARLEYREFTSRRFDDRFRFRHQFLAVSPWTLPGTNGRWFIEEEVFYEFTDAGFNFNWLTTGFRFRLRDGITFKIGYRWQAQKIGGEWTERHVFTTGLNIFF